LHEYKFFIFLFKSQFPIKCGLKDWIAETDSDNDQIIFLNDIMRYFKRISYMQRCVIVLKKSRLRLRLRLTYKNKNFDYDYNYVID
jgi:hypothetical protein